MVAPGGEEQIAGAGAGVGHRRLRDGDALVGLHVRNRSVRRVDGAEPVVPLPGVAVAAAQVVLVGVRHHTDLAGQEGVRRAVRDVRQSRLRFHVEDAVEVLAVAVHRRSSADDIVRVQSLLLEDAVCAGVAVDRRQLGTVGVRGADQCLDQRVFFRRQQRPTAAVAGRLEDPVQVILLHVRQERMDPAAANPSRVVAVEVVVLPGGKHALDAVVVVQGEPDLFEVVGALGAGGRFPDLLDGREQQADEDRDDGDHNEQLDQREGATLHGRTLAAAMRKKTICLRIPPITPASKEKAKMLPALRRSGSAPADGRLDCFP